MKSTYACQNFNMEGLSRRNWLKAGGLGLLGLTSTNWIEAIAKQPQSIAPKAKSVVFLFQWGGPSQLDMFDMKPDAPSGIRSPLKMISSNVAGMPICEELPRMRSLMDRVCLIKGVHHDMKNHNSAGYYALTGHRPPLDDQRLRDSPDLYPAFGSVVDALSPNTHAMPTSVSYPYVIRDGSKTPGQHASFLGKNHDPFFIGENPASPQFKLPELSLPKSLGFERLLSRRELQKYIDTQSRVFDLSSEASGMDAYYDKALSMLQSPHVREAFNIHSEPHKIREEYGNSPYGQSCLLARRLIEAGTKFVTVYFSPSIGGRSKTDGGWDTHGFSNTRMYEIIKAYHLPLTNKVLPTFLIDLERRGLLDETLVIWMGEFGRTPKINANISRDHWPQCYTVLMAGAGVKGGYVHGASDKHAAYPAEHPVKPDDLSATLYHILGIHPHTEVIGVNNRPLPISNGNVIHQILT